MLNSAIRSTTVSEFKEFKPRLKFPKTGFT